MVPKKSQNIAQNKSPTSDLPRKRKKKRKRKRKKTSKKEKRKKERIEDYGRKTTNLLLASAYASAFASNSSLFVEKLWKETVVCLEIVEEITEVERG